MSQLSVKDLANCAPVIRTAKRKTKNAGDEMNLVVKQTGRTGAGTEGHRTGALSTGSGTQTAGGGQVFTTFTPALAQGQKEHRFTRVPILVLLFIRFVTKDKVLSVTEP